MDGFRPRLDGVRLTSWPEIDPSYLEKKIVPTPKLRQDGIARYSMPISGRIRPAVLPAQPNNVQVKLRWIYYDDCCFGFLFRLVPSTRIEELLVVFSSLCFVDGEPLESTQQSELHLIWF